MSLFIFALFIVGVLCLDLSAAGTLGIDIEIGTSTSTTSLHTPDSQLGHWPPTLSITTTQSTISPDSSHTDYWLSTSPTIITQATISLDPSCATSDAGGAGSHASCPALAATELSTQTVTSTISRISLVTVTAGLCAPLSKTVPLNSTVSFRSYKMGTPPIPSPVISTSRGESSIVFFETGTPLIPSSPSVSAGLGKKVLAQQVWPFVAIMVVALGFSCL